MANGGEDLPHGVRLAEENRKAALSDGFQAAFKWNLKRL